MYQQIRVAQRKRGGPITHRSQDRNLALIQQSSFPNLSFFIIFFRRNGAFHTTTSSSSTWLKTMRFELQKKKKNGAFHNNHFFFIHLFSFVSVTVTTKMKNRIKTVRFLWRVQRERERENDDIRRNRRETTISIIIKSIDSIRRRNIIMGTHDLFVCFGEEDSEGDVRAQHGPTSRLLCWTQGWQSLPLGRHHYWPPRSPLIHFYYYYYYYYCFCLLGFALFECWLMFLVQARVFLWFWMMGLSYNCLLRPLLLLLSMISLFLSSGFCLLFVLSAGLCFLLNF